MIGDSVAESLNHWSRIPEVRFRLQASAEAALWGLGYESSRLLQPYRDGTVAEVYCVGGEEGRMAQRAAGSHASAESPGGAASPSSTGPRTDRAQIGSLHVREPGIAAFYSPNTLPAVYLGAAAPSCQRYLFSSSALTAGELHEHTSAPARQPRKPASAIRDRPARPHSRREKRPDSSFGRHQHPLNGRGAVPKSSGTGPSTRPSQVRR